MNYKKKYEEANYDRYFFGILFVIVLICLFIFVIITCDNKLISKSKIIPQEICVNQTEMIYECVEWDCAKTHYAGNNITLYFSNVERIRDDIYLCKYNPAEDDYRANYMIWNGYYVDKRAFCKNDLYKQTIKTTQNCTQQKEICYDNVCQIKYRE